MNNVYSKRDIKAKEPVLEIPSSMIISPFDNFLFKNVIVDALVQIQQIQDSIRDYDQFFSLNILAIQLIIEIRVNREEVNKLFPQYKDWIMYREMNEMMKTYIKSLPSIETMDIPHFWDEDEIKFYGNITYRTLFIRIKPSILFDQLTDLLKNSKYKKEASYLITNILISKDQFEWAFAVSQTRSYTLKKSIYDKIKQRTNISPSELEINKKYITDTSSALIPCFDILNHIFPKEENLKDLNIFYLQPNGSSLTFSLRHPIKNGSEYGYAYSPQVYSAHMLIAYGFTIIDNQGENILSNTPNILKNVTISCLKLCKELEWIDQSKDEFYLRLNSKKIQVKEPNSIPQNLLKYRDFNSKMLMIRRVGFLTDNHWVLNDTVKLNIELFQYVFFYNEISAITEYVDSMKKYWSLVNWIYG